VARPLALHHQRDFTVAEQVRLATRRLRKAGEQQERASLVIAHSSPGALGGGQRETRVVGLGRSAARIQQRLLRVRNGEHSLASDASFAEAESAERTVLERSATVSVAA